ncbi:MAG: sulfatase [Candidatus Latescibacterota bacterium]|nr:sulfatase [Candidatus Latescibacterota bacterium]
MRPNIVYLHSHDTGRYVQPMGHSVPTPNLQRLAEQGVLFRQAFCAAPTCAPSRAALLTGQSAHSSGMLGLAHRGFALTDYAQHLVTSLNATGYRTILAGMQHVAAGDDGPEVIGYDEELEHENIQAKTVSTAAEAFLNGQPTEPFFLDVGYQETHLRYPDVTGEASRYIRTPDPLPDTPEIRRMTAGYHESARRMDEGHGRVLDALERNGLADNTLVICTTDHGLAYPGMKCNLTDHGMGVFLIMRGPGGFDGGKVCDGLVSQIDIFPTLCDLLQIDKPLWLQGTSLMPLVSGEAEEVNGHVFSEVTFHAAYEPQRAVRSRRWKYIRRFDDEKATPVRPNCDESAAKDVWLAHGWADRAVAQEQLYDLVFDPNETRNLISADGKAVDAESEVAAEDLRMHLHRWMDETDDPLLEGPVPAPSGARINDKDGQSPGQEPKVAP